jgi:hypothetical protein
MASSSAPKSSCAPSLALAQPMQLAAKLATRTASKEEEQEPGSQAQASAEPSAPLLSEIEGEQEGAARQIASSSAHTSAAATSVLSPSLALETASSRKKTVASSSAAANTAAAAGSTKFNNIFKGPVSVGYIGNNGSVTVNTVSAGGVVGGRVNSITTTFHGPVNVGCIGNNCSVVQTNVSSGRRRPTSNIFIGTAMPGSVIVDSVDTVNMASNSVAAIGNNNSSVTHMGTMSIYSNVNQEHVQLPASTKLAVINGNSHIGCLEFAAEGGSYTVDASSTVGVAINGNRIS